MINVRPSGNDISALDSAQRTFSLLSSLSFTSSSCLYFSKWHINYSKNRHFHPARWLRGAVVLLRLWVCFSLKAHLVPVVFQTPVCRVFRAINHPSWQHFANVLALTRSSCLRRSCELSARSAGSTLLFLALPECWLSALLFCLLSLHFYHVGRFFFFFFFALSPVHSPAGEQPSLLRRLWHAAHLPIQ